MARRKLSENQKWKIVGMSNSGLSTQAIAGQFIVNQSIIVRLLQRYRAERYLSVDVQGDPGRLVTSRIEHYCVWQVQILQPQGVNFEANRQFMDLSLLEQLPGD